MYWGKIIGALAGAATLKPWFVLLGLGLGHWFDSRFAAGYRRFEQEGASIGRLPEEYLRPLFQTIGHLAKADGRVTEEEIRAARAVMHRIGLGPAQVRHAINWFDEGKNPAYPLQPTMRHLRRIAARRPEQRQLFLRLVLEVVLAKNRMSQEERGLIWTICSEFNIGRVELAQLETMIRAQRGFKQSAAGDADARRIRAAYAALGIDQSATNDEVVKAYRRAMSRNHPDKIAGDDPGEDAIAAAEKRTREVRAAYEMLKSRRSIR